MMRSNLAQQPKWLTIGCALAACVVLLRFLPLSLPKTEQRADHEDVHGVQSMPTFDNGQLAKYRALDDAVLAQSNFCLSIHSTADNKASPETVTKLVEETGAHNLGNVVLLDVAAKHSISGAPISLYAYDPKHNWVSNVVMEQGIYEPTTLRQLDWAMKTVSEKMFQPFLLDIGGNIGQHTMQLATAGWRVLTFEAMNANAVLLRSSLCAAPPDVARRVTLVVKGLDEKAQHCRMVSAKVNVGNGMLVCSDMPSNPSGFDTRQDTLETVRLDDFLPESVGRRIGAVKIDIEGNEYRALKGARRLIFDMGVPFIFAEVNPAMIKDRGSSPEQFLGLMREYGYQMSETGFQGPFMDWVKVLDQGEYKTWTYKNVFFTKKDWESARNQ